MEPARIPMPMKGSITPKQNIRRTRGRNSSIACPNWDNIRTKIGAIHGSRK
jgi:hypothetical protein